MGSKNTDETPAALNLPQNLQDHRVAEQQEAEARREEGRRLTREREEEIQKEQAEQHRLAAEEAQKPANKMRRWLDTLRNAKGVEDQRQAHHRVLSEMIQSMLADVPAEPPKEPTDGK